MVENDYAFQNAHKIDEINTAIACNDMKLLDKLLLDTINVNIPDSNNNYPIPIAVDFSNPHALISLLDNGANPNTVDRKGYTPLMRALDAKYIPNRYLIVVLLLKNGADVNSVDVSGMTPLMRVIKNFKFNEGYYIVKALLKRGADVTLGFEGKSPLVFAMLYNPLYTGILKRFGAKF